MANPLHVYYMVVFAVMAIRKSKTVNLSNDWYNVLSSFIEWNKKI